MPKLAISKDEEMNRIIRGSIKNAQEIQGMNVSKLAKLTGIPVSTLYYKMQNPTTFNIGELRTIFRVLRYKNEEKERLAREAI
ncbi:hypothetical protein [Muricomes intestini]|uniref:hypothetical protein n=1 Tax=Muricomes intestini TaxID=1796634 RepID=UPI002FDD1C21